MIITPGVCVQCLTNYNNEVRTLGSSSINWAYTSVDDIETHLQAMYEAGTPHRVVPTFLYEPDPEG
jgi:hypothetical protein